MADGVSTARLDQEPEQRFARLRGPLGVSSFGINVISFAPGERNRIHRHRIQEEVYVVLEGTLTLIVEGEPSTYEVGDVVRVAPSVRRQLVNRGPGVLRLLALGGSTSTSTSRATPRRSMTGPIPSRVRRRRCRCPRTCPRANWPDGWHPGGRLACAAARSERVPAANFGDLVFILRPKSPKLRQPVAG